MTWLFRWFTGRRGTTPPDIDIDLYPTSQIVTPIQTSVVAEAFSTGVLCVQVQTGVKVETT